MPEPTPGPGVYTAPQLPPVTPEALAFVQGAVLRHLDLEAAWNDLVASRCESAGPVSFDQLARAYRHLRAVVEHAAATSTALDVGAVLSARVLALSPKPGDLIVITSAEPLPEAAMACVSALAHRYESDGVLVLLAESGAVVDLRGPAEEDVRYLLDVGFWADAHLGGCAEARGAGECDCRLGIIRRTYGWPVRATSPASRRANDALTAAARRVVDAQRALHLDAGEGPGPTWADFEALAAALGEPLP